MRSKAKPRELSREELLEKARLKREERRRAKAETKAATVVQKHFRAFRDLRIARRRIESEWDAAFGGSSATDKPPRAADLVVPLNYLLKGGGSSARSGARARVAVGHIMSLKLLEGVSDQPRLENAFLAFLNHCALLSLENLDPVLWTGTLKVLCDEASDEVLRKACGPPVLGMIRSALVHAEEKRGSSATAAHGKLAKSYCHRILVRLASLDDEAALDPDTRLTLCAELLCLPSLADRFDSAIFALVLGQVAGAGEGRLGSKYVGLPSRHAKSVFVGNMVTLLRGCPVDLTEGLVERLVEVVGAARAEGKAEAAHEALALLLSESFLTALVAVLPVAVVAGLYWEVLQTFGEDREAGAKTTLADRLLSFISHSPLLPAMWRELSATQSWPREAPMEATRGWNVGSLARGLRSKAPGTLVTFFLKSYHHFLLVADDTEFYEDQRPFILAEHRAMACTFNCILCNTILHASASTLSAPTSSALKDISAVVASLYERDSKKRFCPPELWLGPTREGPPEAKLNPTPALARQILSNGGDATMPLTQVLSECPWVYSFAERVVLFRELVNLDRAMNNWDKAPAFGGRTPSRLTIRRQFLLEDALAQLPNLRERAKGRIEIVFVSAAGAVEAGLDYCGLLKEFLEEATSIAFDPNLGVFKATEEGWLHPSPLADHMDQGLGILFLAGMLVGKCIYEGLLLHKISFANFFSNQVLGHVVMLEDLRSYSTDLYKQILMVKKYEGNIEDLGLYFAVEDDIFGKVVIHDLMENGRDVLVTNANKILYIHFLADHYLNKQAVRAYSAFTQGLHQLIKPSWLRLFGPRELNDLISGGNGGVIDLADLKKHTKYAGG